MKLKILDLFSGLGGFSLGLERTGNFETVAFCDNDKYSKLVLQKHWKGVKIYNDVKEITKEKFIADGIQFPDIITGGFPCQPFSVAGKQAGTDDDRHLWPVMFRIIQEFTPRWVIGENVKGLTNIQDGVVFETVCTDLEGAGYEVRTFNIPAAGVGAPHRRERIWIVANRKESMVNPDDIRFEQHHEAEEETSWWRTSTTFEPTSNVVNPNNDGSPTTTQRRSFKETGNHNEEGQNKTSEFEGTSGRERNENLENSRRTLRPGTELREKNEDEIRKEDAHQHQRSSRPSESDVANANERNVEAGRERQGGIRQTNQGPGKSSDAPSSGEVMANANSGRSHEPNNEIQAGRNIPSSSSEDVADTSVQGLEGSLNEKLSTPERSQDVADTERRNWNDIQAVAGIGEFKTQEVFGDGGSIPGESAWWDIEPNVGRVAHGIPGRVYRLKGLGNSIIPQIAQEIGNAIIAAEREEKKKGCPHN